MSDIEQKALALLSEVDKEIHGNPGWYEGCNRTNASPVEALCRAIEQHEAFKQKVSDAVVEYFGPKHLDVILAGHLLSRFIIPAPKPDPLVDVMKRLGWYSAETAETDAADLRVTLANFGLEIRGKNDD